MSRGNCTYCFNDIQKNQGLLNYLKQDFLLCGDCLKSLEKYRKYVIFKKHKLYVEYVYNEFLEGMLFQFKEGRDIALKDVFMHANLAQFKRQYKGYTLVLMPSSPEKISERGFKSMKLVLEKSGLKMIEPFYKSKEYKQSLQEFNQRNQINEVMFRNRNVTIPKTKLLLIDDVCTSGATLNRAYELLPAHKYKVEAYVISANPLFLKSLKSGLLNKK